MSVSEEEIVRKFEYSYRPSDTHVAKKEGFVRQCERELKEQASEKPYTIVADYSKVKINLEAGAFNTIYKKFVWNYERTPTEENWYQAEGRETIKIRHTSPYHGVTAELELVRIEKL